MIETHPLHGLDDSIRRRAILDKYIQFNIKGNLDFDLANEDRPISVVIPAFNEEEHIEETILSVVNSSVASGNLAEIIIVDNNSTDRTPDIVKEFRNLLTPVRLLFCGRKGIAPTRKTGMDAVVLSHHKKDSQSIKERRIVMSDGDTTVPEGWIGAIFNQFKRTDSDMVAGIYEYPNWVDEEIYLRTGRELFFKRLSLLSLFLMEQGCSVLPTIGANSGIEVASYAFVNGIDETLPKASDHNLGKKVKLKNGLISVVPLAVQTSPRRALQAMLEKVDFAEMNSNWTDVRGSDRELLKLVLNSHTEAAWEDQKLLREGYIVFGRVILPVLLGELDPSKLIELLGKDHIFIRQLNALIKDKVQDERTNGNWSREKTEQVAKLFSFKYGSLLVDFYDSVGVYENSPLLKTSPTLL